jgi:hypothetical protein
LNNRLGAFIAGKQSCVNGTALEVHANIVEDGIQLCMTNKGVFGIHEITFLAPGKFIITAANREPIVTGAYNLVLVVNDASPYLRIGILAPLSRQQGNTHEIFIPGNIISPFFHLFDMLLLRSLDIFQKL